MNARAEPFIREAARRFENSLKKPHWWVIRRTWVGGEPRDLDYPVSRIDVARLIVDRRRAGVAVINDQALHDERRPHCYTWDAERGPQDCRVRYYVMGEAEYDSYCAGAMV